MNSLARWSNRILGLLLLLASVIHAGEVTDLSAIGLEVNQDLPHGFDLEFVHDLRFINDPSGLHKSISELELSYNINKYFGLATSYRYSVYPDKYSERGSLGGSFSLKTGALAHKLRIKYQHDVDSDDPAEEYLRSRYSLGYKRIFGVKPFVYWELYYSLAEDQLSRKRYSFGLDRKLTANVKAMFYFLSQTEMNAEDPRSARILGGRIQVEL